MSLSLPLALHSRSMPPSPLRVSSPFCPSKMSELASPTSVSLPLPPTLTLTVSGAPVACCPSLTVTVRTAVPVLPETAVAVSVLAAPSPPKVTLDAGTSAALEEVALSVRLLVCAWPSGSFMVRLIVPERSLVPQEVAEATCTVGASLSGVTVMLTLAAAALSTLCATLLLKQGVHVRFVQELLGHADIRLTLNVYSHVLPDMGNATADAMEAALG